MMNYQNIYYWCHSKRCDFETWILSLNLSVRQRILILLFRWRHGSSNSIQVQLQEDPSIIVRVASLEGLSILKIISWDENPHVRNKDALDLIIIMVNYIEAGNDSRLFEEAGDMFREDEINDYDMTSSRFLGRNIADILIASEDLKNKLKFIINREIETDEFKGLIQSIVMSGAWPQYDYQQVSNLFASLLKGLSEN